MPIHPTKKKKKRSTLLYISLKSDRVKLTLTLFAEAWSTSVHLVESPVRFHVRAYIASLLQSQKTPRLLHTLPLAYGMVMKPSMGLGILRFEVQFKLHSTIFVLLRGCYGHRCVRKNFWGFKCPRGILWRNGCVLYAYVQRGFLHLIVIHIQN